MLRAISHVHAGEDTRPSSFESIRLARHERHLRRKRLALRGGQDVLVDLPEPVMLADGDRLVLEDGRTVEILAEAEELYAVEARDAVHLSELAWHLGNRHFQARIERGRILIRRDHVIRDMLEGQGAIVRETVEAFQPVHGAYHAHAHSQGDQGHHDHHD